jgi:hypothetical protein
LTRSFSFAIFLAIMLLSVDALFLQAEMAALDSTPLPSLVVKSVFTLLLLIGGISHMISGRKSGIPRPIFILWLSFILYLMVETLVLVLRFGYPADYVLFSFNAYYFAILLVPFFFYRRHALDESILTSTLVVLFVPLALLGIAQTTSGSLILPTESPNQYLQVMSWGFAGAIRAFSLFSSPSTFGHFIALVGALALAYLLEKRGSATRWSIVVLLALISGYCTLTRATQIEIVCALLTVWMVYHRKKLGGLVTLCPILYGILGLIVAFVLPIWLVGVSDSDLFSNLSIMQRYAQWASFGSLWLGGGPATFLFGAGLAQNDRFQAGADVVIDNSFLAVGVHIGFIGLVLWLAISWYIWAYMLEQAKEGLTPIRAASLGTWSVWMFTSMFGVNIFSLLPFALVVLTNGVPAKQSAAIRQERSARTLGPQSFRPLDASSS